MKNRTRASVVCVRDDKILLVRLEDPKSKITRSFLPGGRIEPHETPIAAATRETLEETGYKVIVDPESELVSRYPFNWNGEDYDVTTHFYRAQIEDPARPPAIVQDASYHKGFFWLPLEDAEQELSFHSEIYKAISQMIAKPEG